jgi:hypothetical protein
MLSNTIKPVTIHTVITIDFDSSAMAAAAPALRTSTAGSNFDQKLSSKHAKAGIMVSQFKN